MRKTKLLLVLILIVLLIPSIWLNTRTGVYVQGEFLRRTSPGEYKSISGWRITHDEASDRFDAVFGSKTFSAAAEIRDHHAAFTFDDGTVIEGDWDSSFRLLDEEGLPLTFSDGIQILVGDEDLTTFITPVSIANDFLTIALNETESYGHFGLILCGIALYALGAAHFLWPEELHFLFSRWKYRNAELSDEGIFVERIGAIMLIVLGAGIMFAPLFV